MIKLKGKHVLRFGGDYRAYFTDSRTDSNARGSFVFTGLYSANPAGERVVAGTGLDFADFLLGMPQQASVQYGPGTERFRGRSWDLFLQDDWRMSSKVTFNLGLRYEFVSPFWEANGRLVTLDVNPDFTAAIPVQAGQIAPFSGQLPSTLVKPDYNDVAPRIGLAWRATDKTIVRGGYGINYNAGIYNAIAQQLSAQPPFAVTSNVIGTVATPLSFSNALLALNPTSTNNFAIDPNYRLGYVQIWNADVQRTVGRTLVLGVGYTGTRGANLDMQRAPVGPNGLRTFIFETSQGRSTMHSVSLRAQKRLTKGLSGGVNYTYSRAFDDASTIGGGGAVVAQNDQDLAAEWGPSSFRNRIASPAPSPSSCRSGPEAVAEPGQYAGNLLGGWQLAANFSFSSGTPFTPRVTGPRPTSPRASTARCARTTRARRSTWTTRRSGSGSTRPPSSCPPPARSATPGGTASGDRRARTWTCRCRKTSAGQQRPGREHPGAGEQRPEPGRVHGHRHRGQLADLRTRGRGSPDAQRAGDYSLQVLSHDYALAARHSPLATVARHSALVRRVATFLVGFLVVAAPVASQRAPGRRAAPRRRSRYTRRRRSSSSRTSSSCS